MLLRTNIGCFIALVIFAITCIYSYSKKTKTARYLGRGILTSLFVLVLYVININIANNMVKTISVCIEYAAVIWVIFFMTCFAMELCGEKAHSKLIKVIVALLLIDSAFILSTPVNRFMGEVRIVEYSDISFARFSIRPMFALHLILMFVLYFIQMHILAKTFKASSTYNNIRYIILAFSFSLIGIPNLIFILFGDGWFDSTRWIYSIGTLLVFYDTFLFSPKRLLRRLRSYVDDIISDATIIYDQEGEVLHINKAAQNMFDEEIWSDRNKLETKLGGFDGDETRVIELGETFFEVIHSDIYDKKKILVATTFVFHDVTENRKQLEREHAAAVTDKLTQSYNRLGFFESAREYMNRAESDSSYVIIISGICNFKGINSLYGIKAGDAVLKEIANKLHELHHKYGFVYGRTAEGKFASLVPFIYVDEYVSNLSRINIDLGDGIVVRAELNHGYVKLDDDVKSLDYYYELALMALAEAKENSHTSALEYSEDMEDCQHKQQMLLSEMRVAIDEGEFFIELQPQINFSTGKIVGAEALVRWNHPSLGRIPPNEFIPLFEDNGYITFLDHFVWEEAAKTIKKFLDEGTFFGSISVNVSRIDIMNTDVPRVFELLAKKYDIPPSKLHVEITESACVDSPDALISTMKSLREKGFLVEIDDFGSGYSSLNALMKLPFDIVKLDMLFMKQTTIDEKNDVVIGSIAQMIHKLHASIIVEGVETETNVKNATRYGADVAQGYYYSKPVSKTRFLELVKEYNDK